MQTIFLSDLKAALLEHPQAWITQMEQQHWAQLRTIAEEIAEHRRTCPIILLSGPSGSGKTITAMMLESILDGMGLETHTLSMDHYFKSITPEQLKLAEIGEFDLESPERVDIPFLNQQLKAIRDCEPVELPRYDFRISSRVPSGRVLQRKPEELVILEGIHALNPSVITLSDHDAARCYKKRKLLRKLQPRKSLKRKLTKRLLLRKLRKKRLLKTPTLKTVHPKLL